jgi:hypothetical protein
LNDSKGKIVACRGALGSTVPIDGIERAHVDDAQGMADARVLRCRLSTKEIRMQFATMVMLAGIGFGGCTIAQAAGQAETGAGGWTEAQSLRELPAGIQALLGVGLGADGIADRGEDFNEGGVRADNMPTRRFALAVVHGDVAMVAVEQGGRAHAVNAVEFRQAGAVWDAVRCAPLNELPRRGTELVDAFTGRHAGHSGSCQGLGVHPLQPPPSVLSTTPVAVRPRPGA